MCASPKIFHQDYLELWISRLKYFHDSNNPLLDVVQVQPFSTLIDLVEPNVPRLLINREKVGVRAPAAVSSFFGYDDDHSRGFAFDEPTNTRDIFHAGDCDTGERFESSTFLFNLLLLLFSSIRLLFSLFAMISIPSGVTELARHANWADTLQANIGCARASSGVPASSTFSSADSQGTSASTTESVVLASASASVAAAISSSYQSQSDASL